MRLRKILLGAVFALAAGAAIAQSPGVNSPFNPVWSIPIDSIKRTYSTQVGALSLAGAGLTDIFQICGAAGVQTKVTQITLAIRANAVSTLGVWVIKRSNGDIGGTVNTGLPNSGLSVTGVNYNSSQAASKATMTSWVANPSPLGATVGVIYTSEYANNNLTTGVGNPPLVISWGNRPAGAPTLLSLTECLDLNLSGAQVTGGLADITAEWTEE